MYMYVCVYVCVQVSLCCIVSLISILSFFIIKIFHSLVKFNLKYFILAAFMTCIAFLIFYSSGLLLVNENAAFFTLIFYPSILLNFVDSNSFLMKYLSFTMYNHIFTNMNNFTSFFPI